MNGIMSILLLYMGSLLLEFLLGTIPKANSTAVGWGKGLNERGTRE